MRWRVQSPSICFQRHSRHSLNDWFRHDSSGKWKALLTCRIRTEHGTILQGAGAGAGGSSGKLVRSWNRTRHRISRRSTARGAGMRTARGGCTRKPCKFGACAKETKATQPCGTNTSALTPASWFEVRVRLSSARRPLHSNSYGSFPCATVHCR